MMRTITQLSIVISLALSISACTPSKDQTVKPLADTLVHFTTTAAPEWTDMFYRKNGWFGADGIFEMTLNGDESIGAGKTDSVLM